MTAFWISAALLGAIAVSFLLVPLWRQRRRDGRWSVAGLAAAALTVPLAVFLYFAVSNWSPTGSIASESMPAVSEMVAALAQRLHENPNDVTGWQLLGRSYVALGMYPEARQAFREAWVRTREPDNELKLSLAEAEVLVDRRMLTGEPGRLFDEVLAEEPGNPKALWYGGLAALELGRRDLARERWTRLRSLDPPEQVAQLLDEQLAMLGAPSTGSAPQSVSSEAAAHASVRVRVRVAEGLATDAFGPDAAVFLFARDPAGGPPVAVLRQPADALPGELVLSDANAMLPGRSLRDFERLTLVARVSATGQAAAQPGDLYGERLYRPAEDPPEVDLVIDQIAK